MRLGKWIRVFERTVPIPPAFSSSFGLRAGSQLHLAPIQPDVSTGDAEIIVSPVPARSWQSVCRLSVRLHDRPYALAKAMAFLRDRRISILLTEAAATFQERAHWDVVCDLQSCPAFESVRGQSAETYEKAMESMLGELTRDLQHWANARGNEDVFLSGSDAHAVFTPLTGLNLASFRCDLVRSHTVPYLFGAVDLPDALVQDVRRSLSGNNRARSVPIPTHALITGNTEQRYLRLYFIENVRAFVMAEVEFDIGRIPGDGIGMLHQVLLSLPESLNLMHLTLHRIRSGDGTEKGVAKMIGHWPDPDEAGLRHRVESIELEDVEGVRHTALTRLSTFSRPDIEHPRVFISYSTRIAEDKLAYLRNELIANDFEPVVGTDLGGQPHLAGEPVSTDVVASAFANIPTCVAFVALHLRRDDFTNAEGRCMVPPWLVAEEVFAFARGVLFLARIREEGVDDPRYNKNTFEMTFSTEEQFFRCVADLMQTLNRLRRDHNFQSALRAARTVLYKQRFAAS